jgi:hypothetical protein
MKAITRQKQADNGVDAMKQCSTANKVEKDSLKIDCSTVILKLRSTLVTAIDGSSTQLQQTQ